VLQPVSAAPTMSAMNSDRMWILPARG